MRCVAPTSYTKFDFSVARVYMCICVRMCVCVCLIRVLNEYYDPYDNASPSSASREQIRRTKIAMDTVEERISLCVQVHSRFSTIITRT